MTHCIGAIRLKLELLAFLAGLDYGSYEFRGEPGLDRKVWLVGPGGGRRGEGRAVEGNGAVVWKGHGLCAESSAVLDCGAESAGEGHMVGAGGGGALAGKSGRREVASGHVQAGYIGGIAARS